jgi:hypothetical protein
LRTHVNTTTFHLILASNPTSVTDFWAPFFNPATQSKLSPGQTINQYCYELEVAYGKNIAAALAPQASTLDLLIWSSLVDTEKWS